MYVRVKSRPSKMPQVSDHLRKGRGKSQGRKRTYGARGLGINDGKTTKVPRRCHLHYERQDGGDRRCVYPCLPWGLRRHLPAANHSLESGASLAPLTPQASKPNSQGELTLQKVGEKDFLSFPAFLLSPLLSSGANL